MGSTVQEDSNVIQNIQCSTTAAAPVTTGPEVTAVNGDSTGVPMTDGESPVDGSGMVTTTGSSEVTEVVTSAMGSVTGPASPLGPTSPGATTAAATTLGASTPAATTPGATTPAATTPAASTAAATMPAATMPAATMPAATSPAATTPAATTPAPTTPAPTTPAPTTPVATTLAVSEQQRAACLVAIEADGNFAYY